MLRGPPRAMINCRAMVRWFCQDMGTSKVFGDVISREAMMGSDMIPMIGRVLWSKTTTPTTAPKDRLAAPNVAAVRRTEESVTVLTTSRVRGAVAPLLVGSLLCLFCAAARADLPDGRAYEQVSPVEKNGADIGSTGGRFTTP